MAHPHEGVQPRFLNESDDLSLAGERARQTSDSQPDTLEVRQDSVAILDGTLQRLRRPLIVGLAAAGVTVVIAAVIRMLLRADQPE